MERSRYLRRIATEMSSHITTTGPTQVVHVWAIGLTPMLGRAGSAACVPNDELRRGVLGLKCTWVTNPRHVEGSRWFGQAQAHPGTVGEVQNRGIRTGVVRLYIS